ncbi:MAG: MFS transporter [Roseomonas sp.]|nr:MFS transporter [Roseomonas sp.]
MRAIRRDLFILTALVLMLAAAFVSFRAGLYAEEHLVKERLGVQREIGLSVAAVIEKALAYGVPFERLVDVDRYLEAVKQDNPELDYLIVLDRNGAPRYATELRALEGRAALLGALSRLSESEAVAHAGAYFNMAIPIKLSYRPIGWLHIGERSNFIAKLMWDIAFDILAVLVVAILVAFELLRLMLAAAFTSPLRAMQEVLTDASRGDFRQYLPRDFFGGIGQLNRAINNSLEAINKAARLRQAAGRELPAGDSFDLPNTRQVLRINAVENIGWPFFLLIFSESLSLSFFPIFVSQFVDSNSSISHSIVIGLPITVFMLVWAVTMPYAGACCDRIGFRKAFGLGALITTLGLVLTAFADSMLQLLLWRSLTAIGYGLVYVTTQAYITSHFPPAERTRGQALFLTTFFAGSLCGAAIGGILVDRLGFEKTFLLSGGLSAVASFYVLRFMSKTVAHSRTSKGLGLSDFGLLIRQRQFATITFLSAVPAKVALAGFLYYSIPLYLKELGHDQSSTGRIMMAYGLVIIMLSPLVAQFADRARHRWRFVMIGGYAAAIAIAMPLFVEGGMGAALAVIGLGIGHAIGVSSQMTLINDRCEAVVKEVGQAAAVGIFRMIERIGMLLGPIMLGAMIALSNFVNAFVVMAGLIFVATTAFTLLLFLPEKRPTSPS